MGDASVQNAPICLATSPSMGRLCPAASCSEEEIAQSAEQFRESANRLSRLEQSLHTDRKSLRALELERATHPLEGEATYRGPIGELLERIPDTTAAIAAENRRQAKLIQSILDELEKGGFGNPWELSPEMALIVGLGLEELGAPHDILQPYYEVARREAVDPAIRLEGHWGLDRAGVKEDEGAIRGDLGILKDEGSPDFFPQQAQYLSFVHHKAVLKGSSNAGMDYSIMQWAFDRVSKIEPGPQGDPERLALLSALASVVRSRISDALLEKKKWQNDPDLLELARTLAGPLEDEYLAILVQVRFDRLWLHGFYEEAIQNLKQLSAQYPRSPLLQNVRETICHEGALLCDGSDQFRDSFDADSARAAVREYAAHLYGNTFLQEVANPVLGSVVGGGLVAGGCALLGLPGLAGCAAFGGAAGGFAGFVSNRVRDYTHATAQIDQARRTGFARLSAPDANNILALTAVAGALEMAGGASWGTAAQGLVRKGAQVSLQNFTNPQVLMQTVRMLARSRRGSIAVGSFSEMPTLRKLYQATENIPLRLAMGTAGLSDSVRIHEEGNWEWTGPQHFWSYALLASGYGNVLFNGPTLGLSMGGLDTYVFLGAAVNMGMQWGSGQSLANTDWDRALKIYAVANMAKAANLTFVFGRDQMERSLLGRWVLRRAEQTGLDQSPLLKPFTPLVRYRSLLSEDYVAGSLKAHFNWRGRIALMAEGAVIGGPWAFYTAPFTGQDPANNAKVQLASNAVSNALVGPMMMRLGGDSGWSMAVRKAISPFVDLGLGELWRPFAGQGLYHPEFEKQVAQTTGTPTDDAIRALDDAYSRFMSPWGRLTTIGLQRLGWVPRLNAKEYLDFVHYAPRLPETVKQPLLDIVSRRAAQATGLTLQEKRNAIGWFAALREESRAVGNPRLSVLRQHLPALETPEQISQFVSRVNDGGYDNLFTLQF